jgi:ferric enterobactin receptor
MKIFFPLHRALWGLGGCLLLAPISSFAQGPGAVRGALLDAGNGQALPFANVVLYRATGADSSLVTGVQTLENGRFEIDKLALGRYTLRATVLGYAPLRRVLSLTAEAPTAQLGPLRLAATTTRLGEVTVQGDRAPVVDNLDKRVINVAKDLTSVGGTAVNVLQNVPSVTVDQAGQVSLRGTSNVTIYIDGKPTGAAGGGRSVNLEQIPASQIESVEVITNPSAKYDAEGGGGIINIVLKKQKQDGLNGNATVNAGTRDKYNTSLSLNRRKGKVNWFGSYDFRQDRYGQTNTTRQRSTVASVNTPGGPSGPVVANTNIEGESIQGNISHAVRLGFDYSLNPENTLTLAVQPRYNQNRIPEDLSTALTTRYGFRHAPGDSLTRTEYFTAHNLTKSSYPTADFTVDYRRTWAEQKRRELTFGAVFSPLKGQQVLAQRQNEGLPGELLQQQDIHFAITQGAAQVDHVLPIGEKGRFDAGLKSTYRGTDGTYDFTRQLDGVSVRDDARSNSYIFHEYVQAGYLQYQNETARKLSFQAGLRVETTTLRGLLRNTGQHFDQDYLNFFPSATLTKELPHDQRLQLGYSRRINRPDVSSLLPFANYSDPRNYRIGNAGLRPENINALELSHQKSWGGATLSSVLFYRLTQNQIQRLRVVDAAASAGTGYVVTRGSFVNAAENESYGLELSLNQPLTKWWRLNVNGSLFRNQISSNTGTEADNSSYVGTARLNTTITPVKKLDLQITANYRSANVTNQGRVEPFYFVEMALRKEVLKDRGSVTFRVSDVFNIQKFLVYAYGPAFDADLTFKRETRVAWLGFNYRFGQQEQKRRRNEQQSGSGSIDYGG